MIDFVESGSVATASDRQLPKIKSHKPSGTSRRNQKKLKTTTTTTTTTPEPSSPEDNSIVSDEREINDNEENVVSEGVSEEGEEKNELDSSVSNSTTTKAPIIESNVTVATEIRTSIPSKGIKISKKPGTSTAKMISGQPLVTQTPPPKEG